MQARRLLSTLALTLTLILALFISLSQAVPGNPDPDPDPNTHTAPPHTTVSLTYSETIDAATVNTQTFAVHAFQTGLLTATYGVRSGSIILTPTRPFFPGELVQTTATTRTLSIAGERPLSYTVWGFRTAVQGGNGIFSPHPSFPAFGAGESTAVALGDVDGDSDLDAIVANEWGAAQRVYLNDGGGVFSPHSFFGRSYYSSSDVALGDVDGDGDLDALVANWYGRAQRVYLNDGTGVFALHPSAPTFGAGMSAAIALGDIDGDGDLDALVANYDGEAQTVWLNRAGVSDVAPTPNSHDVALDASLAITASGSISLGSVSTRSLFVHGGFRGHASGTIMPTLTGTLIFGIDSVGNILYDPDGDWFPGELVQTTVSTGVLDSVGMPIIPYVWDFRAAVQGGSGAFSPHLSVPTFGAGWSTVVALGDVDGDGDLDAIVANGADEAQDVYLNDGDGVFTPHPSVPTFGAGWSHDVALGDVDGDGDLDAIVANYGESQNVYLNDK
jgi:hypothetical protein